MKPVLASIVIVSWNTIDLLRACLRSLDAAATEVTGAVQVIVVDNASADGSAAVLSREFPRVTIIANSANVGFAAATNQGIGASTGRYVVLLNPDTELAPDALRELIDFMERQRDAGAVGPRLVRRDGTLQVSCFRLPTVAREFWRLFHLDRVVQLVGYPMDRWSIQQPRGVEALEGACVLVRRDALDEVGPLDRRFYIYSEDIDLSHRIIAAGWSVYWVPRSVVVHHGGQSTRQVARRMFLELYRSKIEYLRKHSGRVAGWAYKLVLFVAILPRIVVPPLVAVFRPGRRGELLGILRNHVALLVALPTL